MPAPIFIQPSTPVSTVSSLGTNNATTAVQSGPYTKAQFQNTMEGSRSVKNVKEIEQLLRDYPTALELYRTGRYKVKVKYEADIERVILVEKRTIKNTSNNVTKTNEVQQNNQPISNVSTNVEKTKEDVKKERSSERSRSRTNSRDRVAPTTSVTDNNALVQTQTSSIHMASNTQPKVDHHRTPSKEREVSVISQTKQHQQQQQTHRRNRSRDSPSNTSHSKQKGRKNSRDYPKAIVPYVPNANLAGNMWQQPRGLQPYFSNPILQQQSRMAHVYMASTFVPQQNPLYQQPYYYGQRPPPPPPHLAYQKQHNYTNSSTVKSTGNITNPSLRSTHNYAPSSRNIHHSNHGIALPPSFHTFHPNQQQYPPPHPMYQAQIPYQISVPWPTMTNQPVGPFMNNNNVHVESRRGSKHRARSVDTGPRSHPPVGYYNQQQQQLAPTIIEHHHHHRHHYHRPQPTNGQVNNIGPCVETAKEQNVPLKETTAATNNVTNVEKLTIRQLNEIFLQTDPSGRIPYNSLPNILQRFGISLPENDLISAAQDLEYNVTEPISARRLVHVLVKLGKIAKSTHHQQQQQRPAGSPSMLPEDREVTDIMTQRKVAGATSNHIHASTHPNHWY